jgi:hypothetical protein
MSTGSGCVSAIPGDLADECSIHPMRVWHPAVLCSTGMLEGIKTEGCFD